MKINILKIIFAFSLLLTNFNCKDVKTVKNLSKFNFDKVEHYTTDDKCFISSSINKKHRNNENLDVNENKYLDILYNNLPTKIADTSFVSELEKLNYTKVIVVDNKVKKFKEIFSYEFVMKCKKLLVLQCIVIFRYLKRVTK